ncbi:hypothetical protein [Brevibacillus centrosporus]|uniref:hypothetical protein n=1 Tax=Brevibacillus centrosporus TaxID=54910 RepID=UPI003B02D0DC
MDMKTKSKIIVLACIVIPITIGIFAYRGSVNANQEQIKEIKEKIAMKGGSVLNIKVVSYVDSPFEKSGKGNTIYQISYQKDGKTQTAWYRAINQSSILREDPAWLFE